MMQRRFIRRRPMLAGVPRKRTRYTWVRSFQNNVAAISLNTDDLLNNWRVAQGLIFNLPDIVIWRIHIKISIKFTYSPATYTENSGEMVTLFVDDINQVQLNPIGNAFAQQWLMYDVLYAAEQQLQSDPGIGGQPVLYKEYDIRSHRRLRAQQDTLFLQLADSGNLVKSSYSFVQSTLIKLP